MTRTALPSVRDRIGYYRTALLAVDPQSDKARWIRKHLLYLAITQGGQRTRYRPRERKSS